MFYFSTLPTRSKNAAAVVTVNGDSFTAEIFGGETPLTLNNSSGSSVTIDSAYKNVDASARTKGIKITGNALANLIVGGKSNDSVYGGDGADTLVGGSGIIYGFDSGDLLKITGAFSAPTYNASKSSIAFKVGTGSVTLCDFGSTTLFHVNNTTYQLSGSKLHAK